MLIDLFSCLNVQLITYILPYSPYILFHTLSHSSFQPSMGVYQQYGAQPGMMQSGPGMMPMQNQMNRMNAPFANQDPFGPVPGNQVHK